MREVAIHFFNTNEEEERLITTTHLTMNNHLMLIS